ARNTTVAPTNGTTALPRAFLRRLIQAGYRVVPPAKYGGPPDQAMGARNTTVAPTNGTTALPRAFLRRLIQAGYRVVPPAKYGGPPDQAMGLPGVRSFGGMPQRFPAGYPQPWGPVAGAPAPAPYPPPPPFLPAAPFPPSFRQRPNVPQHPGFGGMPQRMPVPHHMMAPPAQMPMRGYPPPAPAIGYPQPHRFPPMMQYPPRQYRHLEQEYMQMKPRERKVAEEGRVVLFPKKRKARGSCEALPGGCLPVCTADPCATQSAEVDNPCGELPLCTPWTGTSSTSPKPTTTQAVEALRRLLKAGFKILPPEAPGVGGYPRQYNPYGNYPMNYPAMYGGYPQPYQNYQMPRIYQPPRPQQQQQKVANKRPGGAPVAQKAPSPAMMPQQYPNYPRQGFANLGNYQRAAPGPFVFFLAVFLAAMLMVCTAEQDSLEPVSPSLDEWPHIWGGPYWYPPYQYFPYPAGLQVESREGGHGMEPGPNWKPKRTKGRIMHQHWLKIMQGKAGGGRYNKVPNDTSLPESSRYGFVG
ncbi:unnamed protein product, partial [Notodromas monacha]